MREFTGKKRGPRPGKPRWAHFARTCTIEVHINISEKQVMGEFTAEQAKGQMEHPDRTPALTPTARTPQCGHTVWVKNGQPEIN